MENPANNKRWRTIEISARDFQRKMNEMATDPAKTSSICSRLALIHQVAKQYAAEAVGDVADSIPLVDILELTDPPLYDEETEDSVIIQFSYTVDIPASVT